MTPEALNLVKAPILRDLLSITVLCMPTGSPAVLKGINDAQRRRHIYAISDLLAELEQLSASELNGQDAALLIVAALERIALSRNWVSSSILNQATTTYGALTRLPQYCGRKGISLATNPYWEDAMRSWTKASLAHVPVTARADWERLNTALRTPGMMSLPCQALLVLTWSHASRVGNNFQVKAEEMRWEASQDGTGWATSIMWTRGKTVGKVGPYTTHTWMSEEHRNTVKAWMAAPERRSSPWVFPLNQEKKLTNELRGVLRRINPRWDLHSLRRGALTDLAQLHPLETVRTFSGHKNLPMLLRYLRWGLYAGERKTKGVAAAKQAFGPPSSPTTA
jgi:hypothetical protein